MPRRRSVFTSSQVDPGHLRRGRFQFGSELVLPLFGLGDLPFAFLQPGLQLGELAVRLLEFLALVGEAGEDPVELLLQGFLLAEQLLPSFLPCCFAVQLPSDRVHFL